MANRPVHWREGIFLGPHHFQLADRQARLALKESEDWFQPFSWGVRSIELDLDALANNTICVKSCKARFKDGTRLSVISDGTIEPSKPEEEDKPDCTISPFELGEDEKKSLPQSGEMFVFLGVPALQQGKANVGGTATENAPRYWVEEVQFEDENRSGNEEVVEVRRIRSRLLISGQDVAGYRVLPLAKFLWSRKEGARPQLDELYVPPLLVIDGWTPLWERVQKLYHHIGMTIDELAFQAVDRAISFESHGTGDAERLLMLWVLNGAYSALESIVFLKGLTPLAVYRELCALVGQLSIFGESRRPPKLPEYDHDNLGPCFDAVIKQIEALMRPLGPRAFEKRYFERDGELLRVDLERAWLSPTKKLFLGVESGLEHEVCVRLLLSTQAKKSLLDIKMGSAGGVLQIFKQKLRGLTLVPITMPPKELPRGPSIVYFEIVRDNLFWRVAEESGTLGVKLNPEHADFKDSQTVTVKSPSVPDSRELKFALFVIDRK